VDLMQIVDVAMEIVHKLLIAGSIGMGFSIAALWFGVMRHP
jgi:hypothetical protein